jgi:4-amino-4-deoxy-L-arabinose transferase-like glycosyltransferase
MKKYLIPILILAAVLRILFLDTHMAALYGDEISIGYNAYSVLKTAKDEFSRTLPIQFESWGDQKNPVYIYLVALFEIVFGLTFWSIRLPSAISGIIAVYVTYLIVKQVFKITSKNEQDSYLIEKISLLSSFLLAINPWHIHVSRGGYEANVALTLGLSGIYFFLKWLEKQSKKLLYFSLISFVVAMYTYYTTKLFVPLVVLSLWIFGLTIRKFDKKVYLKQAAIYCGICIFLCLPIIYLALFSSGQARFQKINIFSNPDIAKRVNELRAVNTSNPTISALLVNKPFIWVRDFFEYYTDNLSPMFWYVTGDSSLRYSIGNHGMFYLIEWPFLIFGMLLLFQKNRKVFFFLLGWLLLAPIPTSLVGKSYGLRSLAILPVPLIFVSYAVIELVTRAQMSTNKLAKYLPHIIVTVLTLSCLNWLIRYDYLYSSYGYYWYDGMQKDAIDYALKNEDQYDNIVISKLYGKTEMYYAFYTKMNPEIYQQQSVETVSFIGSEMTNFGKYYFGDISTEGKTFEQLKIPPNTLIIAAPDLPYGLETIQAKDDKRILFKVLSVKK